MPQAILGSLRDTAFRGAPKGYRRGVCFMLQHVVTFGDARFWSCPRTAFACVGGSGAPEAILGRLGKPVAILGCVCCYIAACGGYTRQ